MSDVQTAPHAEDMRRSVMRTPDDVSVMLRLHQLGCAPDGCSVAIKVFDDYTSDPTILATQIKPTALKSGIEFYPIVIGDKATEAMCVLEA